MNAKPALVRPHFASDLDPQVALWITRLACAYTPAFQQLNEGMYFEELRKLIGITPIKGQFSKVALIPLLKQRAIELEQQMPVRKTALSKNVEMIAELLELDQLQSRILFFAALSAQHNYLAEVRSNIRTTNRDRITKFLSIMFSVRDSDIRKALRPDGNLLATRVVTIVRSAHESRLELEVPGQLQSALFVTADDMQALMASFLESAPRPLLQADAFEVFVVVLLDAQSRVLSCEEMFRGTLTETSVYPREIVKSALAANAAAVIFAHNHPSGASEPSRADESLTRQLKAALALVDVKVLDHFVIAGSEFVSFAERGLL